MVAPWDRLNDQRDKILQKVTKMLQKIFCIASFFASFFYLYESLLHFEAEITGTRVLHFLILFFIIKILLLSFFLFF